MLQLQCQ